jgi:hypothetical protein
MRMPLAANRADPVTPSPEVSSGNIGLGSGSGIGRTATNVRFARHQESDLLEPLAAAVQGVAV